MRKTFRRLFVPDCHFPNHDQRAFDLMLDVASDFRPNEVVYLGDFQDCYCVSDYSKNPNQNWKLLSEELEAGQAAMRELEKRARANAYVFIEGNHENRIERYLHAYAPVLGDLGSVREILKIPANYRYYPYGQKNFYKMPGLVATHGTVTSKHPAYASIQKLGCSLIFGHTHRLQKAVTRNLEGEEFRGYNCGWLGDMQKAAEYIKDVADWSLGFALGVWTEKEFFIELNHIQNYKVLAHGKIYETTIPRSENRL